MSLKKEFFHNGRNIEGYAQIVQGKLWVHFQGQTTFIETQKTSRRQRAQEGKVSTHLISAPMPGKITKIFVKADQPVKKGESVAMMEAMKMEYTLKSERDTLVSEVLVQLGDQVQLGQILIKLKEEGETTT